mgnify:CR=1 FL=1
MLMRKTAIFLFCLSLAFSISAQHRCGTDDYVHDLVVNGIEKAKEVYTVPTEILNHPENSHGKKAVVTIPIVFHVIHEYGPENISKAQILDQVRIINEDFRRQNADASQTRDIFKSIAADCEVEFKLATKDPSGNCTDGITRTFSSLTNGGDEDAKKLIMWDRTRYLNIWVVKSIGRAANILGYAVLPTTQDKTGDGIILLSEYVGTIGTGNAKYMGRTLTHEIGHFLGLWHPFQNASVDGNGEPIPDCGTTNCQNSGDWICDTPPVLSESFGCNTSKNSCTNDSPDLPDQIENFMDYADGECANMFTNNQKSRMQAYLANTGNFGRGSLVTSANASFTGINISNPCAPKADFHVVSRKQIICSGSSLSFEDLSWNGDVVDRVWTFEGGSPSSSTFANPTVTYNQAGTFKVTLKVTNANGSSETTKTEFITVQKEIGDLSSPFKEDFVSPFSGLTWSQEKDDKYGWSRIDGKGFDNDFSMVCTIDNETPNGQQFNLISPNIDLSLHKDLAPVLSFRTAYSMRASGGAGERIVVYGSDDCGETWSVLKAFIGVSTLTSTGSNNPGWEPSSASDWNLQTVNLNQHGFQNSTNLLIRFEVTSSQGNSVFIDDINVDRNVLSTGRIQSSQFSFSLVPNPSTGIVSIKLSNVNTPINIEVLDILGQKIQTLNKIENQYGEITKTLSIQKSGMYFVRVYNESFEFTEKIIISN